MHGNAPMVGAIRGSVGAEDSKFLTRLEILRTFSLQFERMIDADAKVASSDRAHRRRRRHEREALIVVSVSAEGAQSPLSNGSSHS